MESECQILQWITEGLPSDETSHQNAIILKQVINVHCTYFNYQYFVITYLFKKTFVID